MPLEREPGLAMLHWRLGHPLAEKRVWARHDRAHLIPATNSYQIVFLCQHDEVRNRASDQSKSAPCLMSDTIEYFRALIP